MKRKILVFALLISLVITLIPTTTSMFGATSAASPYTEIFGTLDGANYVIRIPSPIENWNRNLVVYCHGYSHLEVNVSTLLTSFSPITDNGYVVAASTYGAGGYCVQKGVNSTYQLTQYVVSKYNVTGKVFLLGISMGGNIALLTSQKYPHLYAGVLDLCGSKDLADAYNTKMDFLAAKDDAEMASKLQAINAPVPPYPFSVLVPPPLSLQLKYWRDYCNQSAADIALECGGTPQNASEGYIKDSPTGNANISRPVITVHGDSDALVPISQTLKYQAAVADAGRSNLYRLYIIPGGQHVDAPITNEVIPRLLELNAWSNTLDGWTLVTDARALKGYPDLTEYIWQKNASMAPNGLYDKIGLHRLVQTGITPKGVVLMLPGTYLSGEGWTSNPPTDNFTKTENDSQAMYWANRGFDVYALDYRTHFVPTNLNSTQLGFMANWGYDQWMSDIKEAVNKVKEVSGVNKVLIAGFSFGGRVAMYYSAKYWQQDIKGIILLDGGTNIKTSNPTNTYNLTALLKQENDTSKWALEAPNLPGTAVPSGWLFQKQYAAQNPSAPAEYPIGTPLQPTTNPINGKPWGNITEYFAFIANGTNINISGGYMNITILSQVQAGWDRYWPDRLNLEASAINDWTNCPYVTYDFNEYYSEVDLPIISFTSELFGLPRGNGAVANTTNLDTKQILLRGYGHMDVYCGVYSVRDVSEPVYLWMVNHSPSGWTLVNDAREMKAYPDLKEYVWQKNATMPPNGQYDKIGLHRLIQTGITPKGVIFITNCPTWGTGEERISNPATDNWTKYENSSQAIYWANRGFDVYAIDYRTHFAPKPLNATQASFAANWGWDVWISDIKEAAEKVKEVSGSSKFFISGECTGGEAALNYAVKYANEDLNGIILLDANFVGVSNYPIIGRKNETNSYNLTQAINNMNTTGNWTKEDFGQSFKMLSSYALQNPSAPAQYPPGTPLTPAINPLTNNTWANITEWYSWLVYNNFGVAGTPPGMWSNLAGGYGNVSQFEYSMANTEFVPLRLYLENMAMADWANCPALKYDYNDHYSEINVPILAFEAERLVNASGTFHFVNGTASSDFTGIMLPNYGHADLFYGAYSARDVSQPALDWMINHLPARVFTLGNTNVGTYQDGNDGQAKSASYFMCNYTGTVTDIFAYVARAGDAGDGAAAIYADNMGSPGALIAATDEATVGTAFSWVDFPLLSPVNVTAGTGYWLAISSNNALNMKIVVGSGIRIHNGVSSWFSDSFGPVWCTHDTGAMSIYASGTSNTSSISTHSKITNTHP